MDAPLLDYIAASKARDAGMKLAADNSGEFMPRALAAIKALPPAEYMGEEIRAILVEKGIAPATSQAWGALINAALKKNILVGTGRFEQTRSVATHRHRTQVLQKVA